MIDDDEGPPSATGRHEFGGPWTLIKLQVLEKYLKAFATALKNQHYRLLYVDAFAGTGNVDIAIGHYDVRYDGSAKIALANEPPFDDIVFIEKQLRRTKALEQLAAEHPGRNVRIQRGDANDELVQICQMYPWRQCRAVLFLDPYGMAVKWETLQRIAATRAIDVWYLFPIAALVRQLARDARAVDEAKAASITACLGTDDWRHAFYSPKRMADLFAGLSDERHATWDQITDFVTARLTSLFARIEGPKLLRLERADRDTSGETGTPLFALYFAISNPAPAAVALACRMARDILKST